MCRMLWDAHRNALSGKRELVGRELTALAHKVEAIYAGHIVAFDKAVATLKTLPQAALDIIANAVRKKGNKRSSLFLTERKGFSQSMLGRKRLFAISLDSSHSATRSISAVVGRSVEMFHRVASRL